MITTISKSLSILTIESRVEVALGTMVYATEGLNLTKSRTLNFVQTFGKPNSKKGKQHTPVHDAHHARNAKPYAELFGFV